MLKKNMLIFISTASLIASLLMSDVMAQDVVHSTLGDAKQSMGKYTLGPCQFQIVNMFGGHLAIPPLDSFSTQQGIYDFPDTGSIASRVLRSFSLFCRNATPEQLSTALNAKYDSGQWLSSGPAYGPEFVPFDKQARVQTIPLKGTNWTAMAYTADDTTGDERIRARRFHFCLIHDTHALCGQTPVMWLENRKVADLWKVKAILQSIRFIGTATSADTAGSATTTE